MATLAQSTEELHLERIELAATREQRTDMEDRFHAAEEDQSVRRQALEFQVSQVMKERPTGTYTSSPQPLPLPLFLHPQASRQSLPCVTFASLRQESWACGKKRPAARSRQVREGPKRQARSAPAVRDFQPPSTCR